MYLELAVLPSLYLGRACSDQTPSSMIFPNILFKNQARAAGYADVIAPPTMAVIWEQRSSRAYVADPEAGIDYSRVVHGEESFAHHRPIVAGDELTATTRVDAIRQAGGHSMITVVTDLADAGGAPVCTASSTIVVRGGE